MNERGKEIIVEKLPASFVAVLVALVTISGAANAQDQAKDAIQKKLEAEYQLTKTTDDKSDIVTAGAVLLLHKDKVLMVASTSSSSLCMNTYKDGKITTVKACGVGEKIRKFGRFIPGASSGPSTRSFVSGEKFWVTRIDVRNDRVVLDFFSDPINDTRYVAALTIPFGALTPSPEEALKAVREVITVAPAEDAGDSKSNQKPAAPGGSAPLPQSAAAPPPAPMEAAPPPLDVPPPPPVDPVEVKLGETQQQVVSALGQPLRKAKTSVKEIYFYKDLKITFVNGKVKDVE